jgi:hypothetical protein
MTREFKPKIFCSKSMNNMADDASENHHKIFISLSFEAWREREREMRKNSRAVDEKGKSWRMRRTIYFGGKNNIIFLEGSQNSLSRISDNYSVKVKVLGWQEVA